jgi:alpha-glucosidase
MLAVMAAAGPAKTLRVPLTFLGNGTYHAALVRDDKENDGAVVLETATAHRADVLTIELRSGGGFVGRFTRPQP